MTPAVRWTANEDAVEVQFRDHGVFRRRVRVPELEGPGGYGIPIMAALTDELEIREGTPTDPGTVVLLRLRRR